MKSRGIVLLVFAATLIIQQLPLGPALGVEAPACCALAQYCPMSARPQERPGSSCAMTSGPTCSIRATCPTGRHDSDGALSTNAQARPAVLDESAWARVLGIEPATPQAGSDLPSPPGKSPPTPPPRSLFA